MNFLTWLWLGIVAIGVPVAFKFEKKHGTQMMGSQVIFWLDASLLISTAYMVAMLISRTLGNYMIMIFISLMMMILLINIYQLTKPRLVYAARWFFLVPPVTAAVLIYGYNVM